MPRLDRPLPRILAVALAVAMTLLVACAGSGRKPGQPGDASTAGGQHVDYTIKTSLLSLVKAADVICLCTVTEVSPPYSATPRVDGDGAALGAQLNRSTVQDYALQLDRAFKSSPDTPNTLIVVQSGTRGAANAAHDDPPLVVGSRYVLFLRRAANGKYGFVSGPQGRVLVDAANRLQPALQGDTATSILRGRTLDQLIVLLKGPTP